MGYFKFEPVLKQTIWGGNKIIPFKHLDSDLQNVGESWEISGVKDSETHVKNGEHKGKSLNSLLCELREKLVGVTNYKRFGNEFPLLIKFIDAQLPLSIQVHPNDEVAAKHHNCHGKSEMWYFMESEKEANILCGLKKAITAEQYKQMVEENTICDAIAEYKVKEGDCFFLPAGRIHSIGAGCFIAEVQQTSDITYRIYDYKRKDKNGNYRELHTELAAEAIDYAVEHDYQTHYSARKNYGVRLIDCPHFNTAVYDIDEPMTLDYSELDSFVILIALSGESVMVCENGETTSFNAGEVVLLPATEREVKISGKVKFLETYC